MKAVLEDILTSGGKPEHQYETVLSCLNDATVTGVLQPLPATEEDFSQGNVSADMVKVLRNRLFRLGYLDRDSEQGVIGGPLRQAITAMQTEAGLTVDGWVGMQSWQALQELFAFEPVTHLSQWVDAFGVTPALKRAICLRLASLGMIAKAPKQVSLESLEELWNSWLRTLALLGVGFSEDERHIGDTLPVMLMFDLDTLRERLVNNRQGIMRRINQGTSQEKTLLRRFLACTIKIELWLLDYDGIKPDGVYPNAPFRRRKVHKGNRYHYSKFYKAIREYWHYHGKKAPSYLKSRRVNVLFNTITLMVAANREDADQHVPIDRLIHELEASQEDIAEHWQPQTWGGRVGDGVL